MERLKLEFELTRIKSKLLAAHVTRDAMRSENRAKRIAGMPPAYTRKHFGELASKIEFLSGECQDIINEITDYLEQ